MNTPSIPESKSLLIIDDEEGPRHSLSMIFDGEFHLAIASSGEEGVECFRERPFSVVITDIKMGGISGIETLRRIRELSESTRVIILTAYETLETAREAIGLGASEYLKKPFDVEQVRQVVERCHEEFLQLSEKETAFKTGLRRAKTNFLRILSHELNTPMNGILGSLQLLEGTDLDDEQREYLGFIRESSNIYFQHVQDILTYARIAVRETHPSRSLFNPATLVVQCISNGPPHSNAIQLKHRIADNLPGFVLGPENEIRLILSKLLENAVKFTEEGSITVELEASPAEPGKLRLDFAVADTGIGISSEELKSARMLDPFVQVHEELNRCYGGLGLGLAVCRTLCEQIGEGLQLESNPGQGSRFSFATTVCAQE